MFDSAIEVIVFFAIFAFFWNVSTTLQQIAEDVRIIAGRSDAKPPATNPEQLIDA